MLPFLKNNSRGRKSHSDDRLFSPFADSPDTSRNRVPGQAIDDDGDDEEEEEEDELSPAAQPASYFAPVSAHRYQQRYEELGDGEDEAEGEDAVDTPLLPIFSAPHLDRLPLYNITHAIRLLVIQRCETTLSWDQLRSPQISQFMVKPLQNQIRTNHFTRATMCALVANCLQFQKEAQQNPGNVGVSNTRGMLSELLAMRLLREFSTRELIDALSYDFDPLQGMSPPTTANQQHPPARVSNQDVQHLQTRAKGARVSTIEIAIRAQAKRFLAHPLVVQHLEAIWAGTVVFHAEADHLHRKEPSVDNPSQEAQSYGTIAAHTQSALPADSVLSRKAHATRATKRPSTDTPFARRTVTLYNPRDASLFKLSRLRVPRYRQIFSTLSFATMLGLFLAVLIERSRDITALEVVFWFWSIGYMLDEVVGFTEQGFGLYILSFWNAFDLGILMLFVIYYCLRLYGIVIAEEGKTRIAHMAYDVLASTAILLFPRLFSVLDHYRYFSQLLIAFRLMAQDLMAILILIVISCSGFFVAFTVSFADEKTDGNEVVYFLFQILMGFTPAAWDRWAGYNFLGKAIMTAFLIICHFVIVTILITVLTNSFMAIVKNAHEEHQFLFAVNTISMVKSDALFSYIAPTNVIGWVLSPSRYLMPFRRYVKWNRTIIKATHFPVLFAIFSYERLILSQAAYDTTDLIEKPPNKQSQPIAFTINKAQDVFSPGRRGLREPSVISFHKDRALDEVFRRPYRGSTVRTTPRGPGNDETKSSSAVAKWMQLAENEGGASPPIEQPRSVVDRLETRRSTVRRGGAADRTGRLQRHRREFSSDPDLTSTIASRRPYRIDEEGESSLSLMRSNETFPVETDADGAGDKNNNDISVSAPVIGESAVSMIDKENRTPLQDSEDDEFFQTPIANKSLLADLNSARFPAPTALLQQGYEPASATTQHHKKGSHARKISSGTTVFAPLPPQGDSSSSTNIPRLARPLTAKNTNTSGTLTPRAAHLLAGQRTPKLRPLKPRPIMPPRQATAPDLHAARAGMTFLDMARTSHRHPSMNARALDLASEIGDNKFGPLGSGMDLGAAGISGMPNSFSEQLLREQDRRRRHRESERRHEEEEKGMVTRIMLARMNTLEEGFHEVLREIKGLSARRGSQEVDMELEGQGSGGSVRARGKRSPRKAVVRAPGAKGKEVERLDFGGKVVRGKDTTGSSKVVVGGAGVEDDSRPGTAVRTTEVGHRSE